MKTTVKIKGMTCASCAAGLTNSLQNTPGVKNVEVNFATAKATLIHDEKLVMTDLEKTIIKSGFSIEKENNKKNDNKKEEKILLLKTALAIPLTLILFVRMFWPWEITGQILGLSNTLIIQMIISAFVVFILGFDFHRRSILQIAKFRANMDLLISIGTLSAFGFSFWSMWSGHNLYFDSAATITTLILLGRLMEAKTKGKASQAMQKLLEMGVKQANIILDNGQEIKKDLDDIKIGDIAIIKAGEKIPLDGVIIDGQADIDESMLTGESMPVSKKLNDQVFAATINQNGVIKIKISSTSDNTMLAKIIQTVEDAQNYKPPMQRFADQIASIFVPVVILIAVLVFVGWFLTTGDLSRSLIYAVSVLVISCPCPLGIATPIAVMVGTSVGAKSGILIKSGEIFEKIKNIDTIIFDKTGTLTQGKPQVQEIIANYGYSEEKVIRLAATLAINSNHPLSKAVSEYARKNNIITDKLDSFTEVPGQGTIGKIKNKKILLGNLKLLIQNEINSDESEKINNKNKGEGTLIFIAEAGQVAGAILITDAIKNNAKEMIAQARDLGLEPIMISGDNRNAAKAVAEKIGIANYFAEVLPHDKQAEIIKLQSQGKKVVFVGDGINDAPALVQADLGIALGAGTDIAKESGDIIITNNDIIKVTESIKLSRKTFLIIKQNLFWAFFYNIIAIPLAASGHVTPMIAALAMACSDVTVVANSLRIYRK